MRKKYHVSAPLEVLCSSSWSCVLSCSVTYCLALTANALRALHIGPNCSTPDLCSLAFLWCLFGLLYLLPYSLVSASYELKSWNTPVKAERVLANFCLCLSPSLGGHTARLLILCLPLSQTHGPESSSLPTHMEAMDIIRAIPEEAFALPLTFLLLPWMLSNVFIIILTLLRKWRRVWLSSYSSRRADHQR